MYMYGNNWWLGLHDYVCDKTYSRERGSGHKKTHVHRNLPSVRPACYQTACFSAQWLIGGLASLVSSLPGGALHFDPLASCSVAQSPGRSTTHSNDTNTRDQHRKWVWWTHVARTLHKYSLFVCVHPIQYWEINSIIIIYRVFWGYKLSRNSGLSAACRHATLNSSV